MAKYYLQSGDVQSIVNAADAEGAALWLLNQVVRRTDPLADPYEAADASDASLAMAVIAVDSMGSEICVSEIGYGRDEAGRFHTELILYQWHSLVAAVQSLLEQISE